MHSEVHGTGKERHDSATPNISYPQVTGERTGGRTGERVAGKCDPLPEESTSPSLCPLAHATQRAFQLKVGQLAFTALEPKWICDSESEVTPIRYFLLIELICEFGIGHTTDANILLCFALL